MPRFTISVSRFFTFLVLGIFFSNAIAYAAEIPEDNLTIDYVNCMTGCTEYEGQFGCEVLCGCTMQRFQNALTEETYLVLIEQIASNEVSPENRDFLDETAFLCVAEMDDLMAEFGLEAPPEGELLLPPPEDDGGQ